WVNLGHALLMQYCDGLETADLRQLDIGQVVACCFYARPQSLEVKIRGVNEPLWRKAVGALQQALKRNPDLVLARANLGLAYLVHPEGRDVKRAAQYFQEALAKLKD